MLLDIVGRVAVFVDSLTDKFLIVRFLSSVFLSLLIRASHIRVVLLNVHNNNN